MSTYRLRYMYMYIHVRYVVDSVDREEYIWICISCRYLTLYLVVVGSSWLQCSNSLIFWLSCACLHMLQVNWSSDSCIP